MHYRVFSLEYISNIFAGRVAFTAAIVSRVNFNHGSANTKRVQLRIMCGNSIFDRKKCKYNKYLSSTNSVYGEQCMSM